MPRVTREERQRRDDKLDEALQETFPASDPPANTVETGIRVGVVERKADAMDFVHAEVPPAPPK